MALANPCPMRKETTYRKLRQIDIEAFRADLHDELSRAVICDNLSDVMKLYERTLLHLLDTHASVKHSKWYDR